MINGIDRNLRTTYPRQRAVLPVSVARVGSRREDRVSAGATGYDPNLFVSPALAYQRVLDELQKWQGGYRNRPVQTGDGWPERHGPRPKPEAHVLRVAGEHGVGKTWLLRHLAEKEALVAPAALYLDLLKRKQYGQPEGFVRAVQQQIDSRFGSWPAVLLLDTVPSHLDEHLRLLEDLVLRPHLSQRGSMLIMALSHPSHDGWRAAILRGGETVRLQPFGQPETRDQCANPRNAPSDGPPGTSGPFFPKSRDVRDCRLVTQCAHSHSEASGIRGLRPLASRY